MFEVGTVSCDTLLWQSHVCCCKAWLNGLSFYSDAGGYDTWVHKHASELTAAVKKVIGEAPLTYVLRKSLL